LNTNNLTGVPEIRFGNPKNQLTKFSNRVILTT